MMLPIEIRTPRLVLRRTTSEHAHGLDAAIEASRRELDAWMAWSKDHTLESSRAFTGANEWNWDNELSFVFTIFHDGEAAGTVGLNRYNPLNSNAEIGYWIRSDLAGRGLMTEAVQAIVAWAFEELGVHRLELHAGLENQGSIRVAEKLGFHREGVIRDGSRNATEFYDCYIYGLLESDPH